VSVPFPLRWSRHVCAREEIDRDQGSAQDRKPKGRCIQGGRARGERAGQKKRRWQ
jgi:hypothetical protein